MDKENIHLILSLITTLGIPVATMAVKQICEGIAKRIEKRITGLELSIAKLDGERKLREGLMDLRITQLETRVPKEGRVQ